ncbi:MAG TPA: FAD-linked oxidase C-terminal domain-containing protein [Candidatus Methylomirabilis sp.]|nr:FAD-linked oxidase C-terminal domain-containing protein [Candidatus Methylomirabilis sp.]
MERAQLIRELGKLVGPEYVVSDPAELKVYETDGLTIFKATPDVVVLPKTAEEIAEVVRLCVRERIPFVPRGAGTGLSGGALALEGGVMIGLNRMNRVLEVDYANLRAVIEPGLVNIWLTNHVSPQGYYYAPDPASQTACSVGGNVAENSGGPHCLKYGVTTNHVLALELVLASGEITRIGTWAPDPPGYDLTGVFVGSEGTFGIVTKIVVRLLKRPEAVKTMMLVFETIADASATVSGIIGRGIIPAAIEMMDKLSIEAVEKGTHAGYPTDAGSVLLVELDGPRAEVEALTEPVIAVGRENKMREVRVAKDDVERALLWKGRKAAFAAMGQISPAYYVQDGVIPRTQLLKILGEIEALSNKYGLRVANVFHAGDGNLHPLILYDDRVEGEAHKAEEMGSELMQRCIAVGGSITGEHGVGFEKKDFMPLMYSSTDLEAMAKVKRVWNPDGLLNPGKIFPTSKSCVEVGNAGKARDIKYKQHRIEKEGLAQRF